MSCKIQPSRINSGYSAEWKTRVPSRFSSAAFTLNWIFRNVETGSTKVTQASPLGFNTFKTSLSAGFTSDLDAGVTSITGYVTDDATGGADVKEVVARFTIEVYPDPANASADDRASFLRQAVKNLRAAYLKLSGRTASSVSVAGKSYTSKDLAEIRQDLARMEEELRNAERAERLGDGCGNPNNILVRFR